MSNIWGLATATKVSRIDTDTLHGYLLQEKYECGYETGDVWFPDGAVTEQQIDARRNRSLIPYEYVYKTAKDFDWSKYGEDISLQKKIVNTFIMEFDSYRREGRGPMSVS